jgi:hypothetical protein
MPGTREGWCEDKVQQRKERIGGETTERGECRMKEVINVDMKRGRAGWKCADTRHDQE